MTPFESNYDNVSVLIIGAGPYGIAVAQELWHRGFDPLVIGRPFNTWHRHTLDVMDLRSDPRGSSVWSPDGRYDFPSFLHEARSEAESAPAVETGPGQDGQGDEEQVKVKLYRRYLSQVEGELPFRWIRGLVTSLDHPEPGVFRAIAKAETNGPAEIEGTEVEVTAQRVIIATGLGGHQHLPEAFAHLPADRLLHSWDVEHIQKLDGRRVLVLGGGQSAAETVGALRGRNQVTWALKRPPLFFREPLRVPTPIFKLMLAGSSWIFRLPPPILRAVSRATFRTTITPSLSPVWKDPEVAKLITDADGLGLQPPKNGSDTMFCEADGREYHAVVSATGYRFSLAGLPFLSESLAAKLKKNGDPPVIGMDFQSALPGLYFVGGIAESTHGPAMRFVLGARHAAKTLGRKLTPPAASQATSKAA